MENSTTDTLRKRTRNPDSKRAALRAAALKLFTDHGYDAVSISQIAQAAGIAVGTVYRFYESKLAILQAMLEELEDDFVEQMKIDWSQGGDVDARLDRVSDGVFDLARDRKSLLRLLSMTTDVVFDDGSLPGDRIQGQIAKMYSEGVALGSFRPGHISLCAAMAHGLVEAAVMRWLRDGALSQSDASEQLALVLKRGFLADTP